MAKKMRMFTEGLTFVRDANTGKNHLATTRVRANKVTVQFEFSNGPDARELAAWITRHGLTFGTAGVTFKVAK